MNHHRLLTWTVLSIAILPVATGCFGRGEKIKIAQDGSATVSISYEGSREDFQTEDALPSLASGWDVSITTKEDGDKQKQEMEAERYFAPGSELPSSYASSDDPDADLCLSFPTELRIDDRSDGTYYYFSRTYQPRRWAYVRHWHDMFFDDDVKALADKPKEELTQDDLVKIVEALAGIEVFKQLEFAKIALDECLPDHTPKTWLLARRATLDVYENDSDYFRKVIERCDLATEQERAACYDAEARRFLDRGYAALTDSLEERSGFTRPLLAAFDAAFERASREYRITDQLGGHYFEIEVEMPGKLVATNGEDADYDADRDATTVKWQFEGNAFRDRGEELVFISRIDRE